MSIHRKFSLQISLLAVAIAACTIAGTLNGQETQTTFKRLSHLRSPTSQLRFGNSSKHEDVPFHNRTMKGIRNRQRYSGTTKPLILFYRLDNAQRFLSDRRAEGCDYL